MRKRFYVIERNPLDSEGSTECLDFTDPPDIGYPGEAPRCEACGAAIGLLPWQPPHRVELEVWGRVFGDIVAAPGRDFIISEDLKSLVEGYGIKGLSGFDPVKVVRVIRRAGSIATDPPKYFRVSVVRSPTAIDLRASDVEMEGPVCPRCRTGRNLKRWKRVIIEPGTWSGDDVFEPRGLPVVLATERFRKMCRHHSISNALFVPAEVHQHDYYPWEKKERLCDGT